MATSIPIVVRGSTGVSVALGPPQYGPLEQFVPIETKSCRVTLFSPEGDYLAYAYGNVLRITRTDSWTDVATVEGTKAYFLSFSPKGTYLVSWEPYEVNKNNPQGSPNLRIYESESGRLVKSFVHKPQSNWEPRWSEDEKLFSKMVNADVVFYEDANFERIVHRINCYKIASYSVSPMPGNYYVLCHMPGTSGQPSFARLFKYPNFEAQQVVANKSFFQADKVEYFWNSKGMHSLLLTITEQDKTGKSYYGKQSLQFIGVNGQTNIVSLSKEGSIHSVAWSPKGHEFCVVYGFMPAKATVFNLKCESVFEVGSGPYNSAYYNPQGNILLLGGFGNLVGHCELWNLNTKKQIAKCDASDTTLLEWCPDGVYFMTATTSPRLRISNGFRIWHHTGTLVFEKYCESQEELYDVSWQKFPKTAFKEPVVSDKKVEGITSKQAQASTQAYRPPSARNRPEVKFKLHDDDEPSNKPGEAQVSKNAMKQRKKREARKARKAEEGGDEESVDSPVKEPARAVKSNVQINLTGDPEKDKKIKNIQKKLNAIEKLKADQAQGKPLEINQIAKIKGEEDLIKELNQLQL